MAELEVVEYANSLLNMARSSWVNRHFHSKRKERTIGARYDRLFVEILEALLEEQEQRPGSFDREYWTGKGCYDAFGVSRSHEEAGYIEASKFTASFSCHLISIRMRCRPFYELVVQERMRPARSCFLHPTLRHRPPYWFQTDSCQR